MSESRIHFEVDFSRNGLLDLRRQLDELLDGSFAKEPSRKAEVASSLKADRKVGEVWGRVGDNIKRFLTLGALLNAGDLEFSLEQIASGLQVPIETVRSWHRNLGRTLNQVNSATPEPVFMHDRWDGTKQNYTFPREVRSAILERAIASEVPVAPIDALRAIQPLVQGTPALAVAQGYDVLEDRLRKVAALSAIVLPSGTLDMRVLTDILAERGMVSPQTADALVGLAVLRDAAVGDPSGSRTTSAMANEFLKIASATLSTLKRSEP